MTNDLTACEEFHGLRSRPFSLTPDLRFTYHSRSHTHALEQIAQALKRREGLIVVTGEVGTGKTMLCRALLDTFETRTFLSVVLDPLLTVEDLLRQVLTDFGLMSARDPAAARATLTEVARHDLVAALQKFLASLVPLNAHAVIMIDEAQHLTGPVLEQVRLLSNFETDSTKLLQIVLVGQPNLDILLQRPDMNQLNQRVARRCELEPLTREEVRDYVERRLLVAGEARPDPGVKDFRDLDLMGDASSVRFSPEAIQLVATVSRGIPRLVNTVCDLALEGAFDARAHVVDRKAVLLAANRLRLAVPSSERFSRTSRIAVAAAIVVLALGGAWWWASRGPATRQTSAPAPDPITAPASAPAATPPAAPAATPLLPAPALSAPGPSPTPAPTTASSRAPLGGFEITAASFRTGERAAQVAQALAAERLPVEARLDATGQWYRVVVGPFASAVEAQAAQQKLEALGFTGTRLLPR